VDVLLTAFAITTKSTARRFSPGGVHRLQPRLQLVERQLRGQRKIEILRKAIGAKIAALQRRSAFESEHRLEVRWRERRQEPGEAVVAFKHALGNAASAFPGKPVGEKGEVALWDHLARPDRFEFLGRDVKLKPPA